MWPHLGLGDRFMVQIRSAELGGNVIEFILAAFLHTAHAAPLSAPIAPGIYRVRKLSGDGSDLSIDSIQPRVIHLRGGAPQTVTVTVKGIRSSNRQVMIGGASTVRCADDARPGTYVCVLTWAPAAQQLRGEWLSFNVIAGQEGALAPGARDTKYLVEIPITRVETRKPIAQALVDRAGLEVNTNRFGSDYRSLDAADAQKCQSACADEVQCKAWTWVKSGVQGSGARCWLKNSVPVASKNNCCTSGVK
jgi:PAN domain